MAGGLTFNHLNSSKRFSIATIFQFMIQQLTTKQFNN
jgi:hypothetical protein